MNNQKSNKRTSILIIILLALLILAYKVIFAPAGEDMASDENIIASARAEAILKEIETINFDMAVVEDPTFKSLKSIEIPLLTLPVGRPNPFSAGR